MSVSAGEAEPSQRSPRKVHYPRDDGTVLVAGGNTYFYDGLSGQTLSAVELFDPVAGTFTSVADMTTPRESHTATLLLSGQVLQSEKKSF